MWVLKITVAICNYYLTVSMYKIKLPLYAKRYNLSIDQTLYGNLDVSRLKAALKRYITEHALLNSHVQGVDGDRIL
jgi:hypothetical protein